MRLNLEFTLLLIILCLVNLPSFSAPVLPMHDSMSAFQIFHYMYSGLLYNGALPQWIPYDVYGAPVDFWMLTGLSPFSYVAIFAGKLLGTADAMFLFKSSLLLEQLAFLIGLYTLARLLYANDYTVLAVCSCAILTTVWQCQIWWNFRIYYLLPLALASLLSFFRQQKGAFLWLSGATILGSLLGNLPYFAPIYLFLFTICCFTLSRSQPGVWRVLLKPSRWDLCALALAALLAGIYLYATWKALHGQAYHSPSFYLGHGDLGGRAASSKFVPLPTFLGYPGHPPAAALLVQALFGWPSMAPWEGNSCPDQTVYAGLSPLLFAGWALWRVKTQEATAFKWMTILLLWLSLGGLFSTVAYLFPGMIWFRHLGLLYALAKILLLIYAGFGMDDFLQRASGRDLLRIGLGLLALSEIFTNDAHYQILKEIWAGKNPLVNAHAAAFVFQLRALIYALCLAACWAAGRLSAQGVQALRLRGLSLLLGCLLDTGLFATAFYLWFPSLPVELTQLLRALPASRPTFAETRSEVPVDQRGRDGMELLRWELSALNKLKPVAGQIANAFLQFDPARSSYSTFVRPAVIDTLLSGGRTDPAFARVLGHGSPKLRLVAQALGVPAGGTAQALKSLTAPDQVVILEGWTGGSAGAPPAPDGTVRVIDFSPNQLTIEVELLSPAAAWVVYADSYDPGWRASLNDQEVPIQRAYGAFKAVQVQRGKSQLRLSFRQAAPLSVGGAIAGVGVLLAVAVLLWWLRLMLRPWTPVASPSGCQTSSCHSHSITSTRAVSYSEDGSAPGIVSSPTRRARCWMKYASWRCHTFI